MIYLDNAATSWPKPESVRQAIVEALDQYGANPRPIQPPDGDSDGGDDLQDAGRPGPADQRRGAGADRLLHQRDRRPEPGDLRSGAAGRQGRNQLDGAQLGPAAAAANAGPWGRGDHGSGRADGRRQSGCDPGGRRWREVDRNHARLECQRRDPTNRNDRPNCS